MAEQHVHLPVQDAIPNQEQERSADIPVREAVLAASCSTKSHKKNPQPLGPEFSANPYMFRPWVCVFKQLACPSCC